MRIFGYALAGIAAALMVLPASCVTTGPRGPASSPAAPPAGGGATGVGTSSGSGSGLLPLGDGRVSDHPVAGSVYACQTTFPPGGLSGAATSWIIGDRWNPAAKPTVDGSVSWPGAQVSITVERDERVVRANNLPRHPTGVFPISPSDDAYRYDRNPNSIRAQQVLLRLPARPAVAAIPSCVPMGMIGFAVTGAALFNALDAQGRDAAAHEIQDSCAGHPEQRGSYHYHNLGDCGSGPDGQALAYALDGFGVYAPDADGRVVTNADLDACHGHTGPANWDGRVVTMYHYHFTTEYPYSIGCFAGTAASR